MRWLFALVMLLLATVADASGGNGSTSDVVLVSIGGRPTIFAGSRAFVLDGFVKANAPGDQASRSG